jgi:hypothetical protein
MQQQLLHLQNNKSIVDSTILFRRLMMELHIE